MNTTIGDGYTCPVCGTFVFWNQPHTCYGGSPPPNAPVPMYPAQPFMPYSPPITLPPPFTPEDIRRVVREEVERLARSKPAVAVERVKL